MNAGELGQAEPIGDELAQAIAEAEGVAAEIDGTAAPGQAADMAQTEPQLSNAQHLTMMLEIARAIPFVQKKLPRVAAELTDEPIAAFSESVGAVLDKYRWDIGGMGAEWGVEIRALLIGGGFMWAVAGAVRADLDDLRAGSAKDVTPAATPAPAPEGDGKPNPFSYGGAAK